MEFFFFFNYESLFGSSDHVIIEMEIKGDMEVKQEESHKKKRRNYAEANYAVMKTFLMKLIGQKLRK